MYHYAGNNPVKYVDPTGRWFGFDDIITGPIDEIAVLGALTIIGAVSIYNSDANKNFAEALKESCENNVEKIKNLVSNKSKTSDAFPSPLPPDSDDDNQETNQNKPTSQNQMQKQVERGKAPKEIERVDKAHQKGGKNHVHFKDGTSLNQDGTIHDAHRGVPNPSKASKEWLKINGWSCGE